MIDPRVKLRHLVCFVEVARLRSVVKAAAVLGISQPAASKTLQELERILGVPLFDRSRRAMALTPFGDVFLRYAGASITALRQGMHSLANAQAAGAAVTVGALPTVSARILPAAIVHFTAQRLAMTPRVVTGPNGFLLSQLRLGDVDLVIGRMADPDAMAGLSFEHLYSEKVVLVVRPGHPLSARSPFDPAAIAGHQVLMPPPGALIRPSVDRLLVAHGIGPLADQVETVSNAFGRSYTRATDAVWIISEGVVAEDLAEGQLASLPLDAADTFGPVGLTTRTDMPLSLPAQLLAQSVRMVVPTVEGVRIAGPVRSRPPAAAS